MVNGIGSVNASSLSFSSTSIQQLLPETKAKLEKLGIDTSSVKTESQGQLILKSVEGSQGTNSSQNVDNSNKASTAQKPPPGGQQPEWISLMQENGISPTGSIEGDKAAVSALLSSMESEKAQTLATQFQAVGLDVSPSSNQQQDALAGQNQLAELNKFFLVNRQ